MSIKSPPCRESSAILTQDGWLVFGKDKICLVLGKDEMAGAWEDGWSLGRRRWLVLGKDEMAGPWEGRDGWCLGRTRWLVLGKDEMAGAWEGRDGWCLGRTRWLVLGKDEMAGAWEGRDGWCLVVWVSIIILMSPCSGG